MANSELLPGALAPEFALKDKDGEVLALKDVHARHLVVYVYPKDNTPGCTIQAQRFNEALSELRRQKREVGLTTNPHTIFHRPLST